MRSPADGIGRETAFYDGTTGDEPAHIAAGLTYLQTGIFHFNLQHLPLLKELSAAALALAGVRFPQTQEAMQAVPAPPNNEGKERTVGYEIIKPAPDRVRFWARLPMIVVDALLGCLSVPSGPPPARRGRRARRGVAVRDRSQRDRAFLPGADEHRAGNSAVAWRNRAVRLKQSRDRKYLYG